MARSHGKDVRVYLGSRDASADLVSIEPAAMMDTHDVTTFGAEFRSSDAGLGGWEAGFEAFYQPQSGGIGRQLESIGLQTSGLFVVSIYDGDADGVGDAGILGSEATLTKRAQPISVADMIKLSGTLQGNGQLGMHARLLHALAAKTTTSQGASYDNAASSANGGRGNLHVTAATGSGTIKIQHSPDDAAWADLITFTAATGATSESKTVTGTVDRYLRAQWAPGTSITFVVGFARY